MKKVLITVVSIVVIAIGLYIVGYYHFHTKPINQIENFLSEHNLNQNIYSKENFFEWGQGKHEIIIVYEDEPHLRYEYGFDAYNNIMVIVFNQQNIAVEEAKRLKLIQ